MKNLVLIMKILQNLIIGKYKKMSIDKYLKLAKNELFHLNRSISGAGINKTLNIIKKKFPNLKIKKVKSGTKAFDG